MFCSSPSGYLWEDAEGTTHTIVQEEGGGENRMMPLLFSHEQHPALVQRRLVQGEHMYLWWRMLCGRGRGSASTRRKRRCGTRQGLNLQGVTWVVDQSAHVWRGPELPTHQQGVKILGTPHGHPDLVRAHMDRTAREHQTLLDRIPLQDVQAVWLLLLHCASAWQTIWSGWLSQCARVL